MNVDREACVLAWRTYLSLLPPGHPHHEVTPDAFAFGGEPALADQLAALVITGQKRATTSLAIEFTSLNEALPKVGDVSIIVRGDGLPVAIIERREVSTVPFDSVDHSFAAIEGEGDGSLAHWRAAHTLYFNSVCDRLGGHFDGQTPVICQIFHVLWKSPVGV